MKTFVGYMGLLLVALLMCGWGPIGGGGGGSINVQPTVSLCGTTANSFAGDYGSNIGLSCSTTCSVTLPLPSGTAAGCMDVIELSIIDNAPTNASMAAGVPAGWNESSGIVTWGGSACATDTSIDKMYMFWRIHQAGDSNPTFTWTAQTGSSGASVITYAAGSFKNAIGVDGGPTCGSSTTLGGFSSNTMTLATAAGLTPTLTGDMWLGLWSSGGPQASITPSLGTVGKLSNCGGSGCGGTNSALIYAPLTSPSNVGPQTVSWGSGAYWGFGQALLQYGIPATIAPCGVGQIAYNADVSSSTGQAVNTPSGCTTTNGPVLLMIVVSNRNGTSSAMNTPSGFTLESQNTSGITDFDLYYKVYVQDASMPASVTLTPTTTGGNFFVASFAAQGFATATPFDGTPTLSALTTAATSVPTLGITTTDNGDLIYEVYSVNGADEGNGTYIPAPNGIQQDLLSRSSSPSTSATGFLEAANWTQSAAGATGVDTLGTLANSIGGANSPRFGMTIAIQP